MKNSSLMFSLMTGRGRLSLASALLTACAAGCCASGKSDDAAKSVEIGRAGHPGDKIVVQHDPTPQSPGPHQNTILVSSADSVVLIKVVPVAGSALRQTKIVIKTLKPFVPTVSEEQGQPAH